MHANDNKTGGRRPSELYIYVIHVIHDSSLLDSDFSEPISFELYDADWYVCRFTMFQTYFPPGSHSTKSCAVGHEISPRPGETKTMVCPKARRTSTKTTSVRRLKVGFNLTLLCWGCYATWNLVQSCYVNQASSSMHGWNCFFLQKFILVTNDELKHFINLHLALKKGNVMRIPLLKYVWKVLKSDVTWRH